MDMLFILCVVSKKCNDDIGNDVNKNTFPPVLLRAVCFVRAIMKDAHEHNKMSCDSKFKQSMNTLTF